MSYVFPAWVFLDAVIEFCGSPGEFANSFVRHAIDAFGIRVGICDTFLNSLLEPIPLFFGRFAIHLPEHYRGVAT